MTDLWWEAAGQGPNVLLLHSGLSDSRTWDAVWPLFTPQYRVVRYDTRGFGRSPDPTAEYDLMEDAVAVLDALGISDAHLVGNSMGASVARGLALFHPERVRSLTLVGPGFPAEDVPDETIERMRAWRAARDNGDVEAALTVARQEWIDDAEQEARLRELIARQPREGPGSRPAPEGFNEVDRISVPVLIILGDRDSQAVVSGARELARRIPNASLRVIEGAKHHPQEDRPEEFAEVVSSFIAAAAKPA